MKTLVKFFLERPILVNIIVLLVFGYSLTSISKMKKEAFPELALGRFVITTIYPGASAGDIELNVTLPIEETLREVEGIQELKSYSRESVSIVDITANENYEKQELQRMYMDIDSALSTVKNLPSGLDNKPILEEISSSDLPVVEITFSGEYKDLIQFLPKVEDEIAGINGIASVTRIGLGDEEVHILVDPLEAKKNYVDLLMIANAIKKRNIHGSGGTLQSFTDEKKIVSYEKFNTPEEVLNTNILMSQDGFGVKLKNVATIEYKEKDTKLIVRNNGKRGASLLIKKQSTADILKTIDSVSEYLDKLQLPAGVSFKKLNDGSKLTRNRIQLVMGNAIVGFILVVISLFIVFDIKTALWTGFGIPFTLLTCLVILYSKGLTLNMFVLGGFILVIGMLVDDAIVIAETINRNLENGLPPIEAASSAVAEVWKPVIASSATTMVAFSPLVSLGGLPGKFIWMIPLVVILCLTISLFESFFLLPVHLSEGKHKPIEKKQFILKLEEMYRGLLQLTFRNKKKFLLSIFVLLVSTFLIGKFLLKKEPFPQEGAEGFIVSLVLPKGSSLERTETVVKKIEEELLKLPEIELDGFSARVGTNSENNATEIGSQANAGVIFVYLKPYQNRKRTAEEIRESIKLKLDEVIKKEVDNFTTKIIRFGPPLGRPFEIRVVSNDSEIRKSKMEEIKKYLSTIGGIYDIDDDELEGKGELNLVINHDLLSRSGLTVEDLMNSFHIAYEGLVVTDIVTLDKTLEFRLKLNEKARSDINFIYKLPLLNKLGQEINLKQILTVSESKSLEEMKHIDRKRFGAVFGNLDRGKITPEEVMLKVKEKFPSGETYKIDYSGEPIENQKIFKNLGVAAIIALLSVYLIIVFIFNSFFKPFIVILAIPFGIIGVIYSIFLHGMALSMFVGIALIGLLGVIVNNSILMVYTTSEGSEGGLTDEIIINGAVQRLRPIMLTTITTILGLLPTAYGIGGHDPVLSPMSLALSYGLLFGTIVVLYFIPVIYSYANHMEKVFQRK